MNNVLKSGFTLAEVLITLAIIGVIATITIPALIGNVDSQKNKAAMKVAYSNIAQAIKLLQLDGFIFTDNSHFMDALSSKMNYSKKCTSSNSLGNCWSSNSDIYAGLDPVSIGDSIVLNNGQFIGIAQGVDPSTDSDYKGDAVLMVDSNGIKPPNKICQDIFYLVYYQDKYLVKPPHDGKVLVGLDEISPTCDGSWINN